MKSIAVISIGLGFIASSAIAGTVTLETVGISPGGTFLTRSSGDTCANAGLPTGCSFFNPTVVNLSGIGVNPGDILQLTVTGFMDYAGVAPAFFTLSPAVLGLFSTTSSTGGAVGPPTGYASVSTMQYFGSVNNTNPNDFLLGSSTVTVPTGVGFLLLGIDDSFFSDNTGNVSVTIAKFVGSVPEPGAYFLTLAGLGLIAGRKYLTRK